MTNGKLRVLPADIDEAVFFRNFVHFGICLVKVLQIYKFAVVAD